MGGSETLKAITRRALERMRQQLAESARRGDPWERLHAVPARQAGTGSLHEFTWYLEGDSTVAVTSVEELCNWLLGCEYAHDRELFNEDDFWQHPSTFERLRSGDCEDHAIWAWRKLRELGIEAELMFGIWRQGDKEPGGHAWVRFMDGNDEYVLESVGASSGRMLHRFDDVRNQYVPHMGVDCQCRVYAYGGMWQGEC